MFELIKIDDIKGHLCRQHLLYSAQHDFATGYSCLVNLISTVNMGIQLMDNEDYVDMCFLNFSKAFDILNHRIICPKFAALGTSPQVVGWILSFLQITHSRFELTASSPRKQSSPVASHKAVRLAH